MNNINNNNTTISSNKNQSFDGNSVNSTSPMVKQNYNMTQTSPGPSNYQTGQSTGRSGIEEQNRNSNSKNYNQNPNNNTSQNFSTETTHVLNADELMADDTQDVDDLVKKLFRSKEVQFQKRDPNQENYLNTDLCMMEGEGSQENTFVDRDKRIIMHRAALDQRVVLIKLALEQLHDKITRREIVNKLDKYGNTPLLLSCVNDYQERILEQREVVNLLISEGNDAYVDAQNPNSNFTTLHWACIHGRKDIVKMLIKMRDAKIFIPDKQGFCALDYAGKFQKFECVTLIIDHLIKQIKDYRTDPRHKEQIDSNHKLYVDDNLRSGLQVNSHTNPLLLFSPVLHTSALYWACMNKDISEAKVEEILQYLEAYPELPILADNFRTPCHAAAQSGNEKILRILLKDIKKRYEEKISFDDKDGKKVKTIIYTKIIIESFKDKFSVILRQKRYKELRKFYNGEFERRLYAYGKQAELAAFSYDFQDQTLNTPLHLAAQYGNDKCVALLINEEYCSQTLRNSEGWMPKDLQQHEAVAKKFGIYLMKKERLLKFISEHEQELQEKGQEGVNDFAGKIQEAMTASSPKTTKRKTVLVSQDRKDESNPTYEMIEKEGTFRRQQRRKINQKAYLERDLILCRNHLPQVPPFVLKVSVQRDNSRPIINGMVNVLKNQGFNVQMFPSAFPDLYYISLKLKQQKLEEEARNMKLKIKLCDVDIKQPFEPNQKIKFEPFRTKDQQKIIMHVLKNILSPESLIEQKILIKIIPMHDFSGIHEIKEKWENYSKFWPQPIFIIKQFYQEGMNFDYRELSAIKNYFGEKTGFYFAWMSFYTSWILIPAVLGFILTIYQIISKVDNIFTSLYSLIVCIWVTIFIERWRRKSSEIALKWGVKDESSEQEREVRADFNGDEYFSNINYTVGKKNVQSRFYLFLFLSIPVFVILIGICIGVYFATRYFQQNNINGNPNHDRIVQILAGVINGVSIAIVNFIYQQLATISMRLENHKYEDTYEQSFIFKLFAFKFINTNISLFYTAFIDQNFNSLYYLIVGMALQKAVQIFCLKILKKYLMFWYYRRSYFKRIREKAMEQRRIHDNFMKGLDLKAKGDMEYEQEQWRKRFLYQSIMSDPKQPMTKDMEQIYYRLVFNLDKNNGTELLLIDYIELNSYMTDMLERDQINEISEVFILFGLATLYACACPIVAFIVMIHNLVDMNWDLWTQYTCIKRPISQTSQNIGPWLKLAEFMAIFAVISNSLLLYFSSPTLKSWLEETFDVETEVYLLWIIVALEHLIIIVKIICQVTIPDIPNWVIKSLTRVKIETKKITKEENERDENFVISGLKDKLTKLISRHNNFVRQAKESALKTKEETENIKNRGKQAIKDKKEKDNLKGVQILKQIEEDKNKSKSTDKMGLIDFLGVNESEWLGKQRTVEMEKALSRNMQRRLMSLTFNKIEKDILQTRIMRLYQTKRINQINCSQCSTALATLECLNCQDHFCQLCSNQIHHPSNQILAMHSLMIVPIESTAKFSLIKPQTLVESLLQQNPMPQTLQFKTVWKKFEYFNFALDPGNDLYFYIQKQYVYLRQQYIDQNYIQQGDKIDYQGLFVDKQYDMLTDHQAKALQEKYKKVFGDQKAVCQNERFNDEEQFYMNRIAFYLFKYKGENLTFANYVSRLSILQHGSYQRRLTLWLSLMDEAGDEMISRDQLEQYLHSLYIQDMNQQMTISSIVNMIYQPSSQNSQNQQSNGHSSNQQSNNGNQKLTGSIVGMNDGQNQQMSINKLIEKMSQEGPAKQFMECVLQYNENEVRDKI